MTLSTSDFSIFPISRVLPYGKTVRDSMGEQTESKVHRRTYVPKGSRPHLLWTTSCSAKGSSSCSFPFSVIGTIESGQEGGGISPLETQGLRGIRQLLTVDAETGLRLQQYGTLSVGSEVFSPPPASLPIPSRRPIVSLCLGNKKGSDYPCSEVVYVSDEIGNIYSATSAVPSDSSNSCSSPLPVRRRTEGTVGNTADELSQDTPLLSHKWHWTLLTPSNGAFSNSRMLKDGKGSSKSSGLENEAIMSGGAPGWAGLSILHNTREQHLLSLREFYQDARVLDCEREGLVVQSYGLTHAPTGMYTPTALPFCFVVAEGSLCTVFDTRCPGVVMGWREGTQLNRSKELPCHSITNGAAISEPIEDGNKAKSTFPPLVQQQFTSVSGLVRDVCKTAEPLEVALCIERALCVFDLRRFTRLFTSSNVLKFHISSITPIRHGNGIVCTGIDSEVCVIPVSCSARSVGHEKDNTVPQKGLEAEEKGKKETKVNHLAATTEQSKSSILSEELAGSFRSRLKRSMQCEEVWQGGWVASSCDFSGETRATSGDIEGGACAVGISITGELYIAQ